MRTLKNTCKNRCAVTYAVGTLQNTFNKFAVLLRMQWGPLKIPSNIRCAVTYAVGTLQNTFKTFAVLLRMQWGPFKIPSNNSLCCYVCCGDLSKYLQKIRCAVTYALGTLKNTFNCSQSRKIHANTAFRIPADYLLQTEPSLLSASGCAYEVGNP